MSEHSHDPAPPPAHAGTIPAGPQTAPAIVVTPFYKDPATGELFLHRDMFRSRGAWEEEAHVSPTKATEKFGDVESFAAYVKRYGLPAATLVAWNATGIWATLDYHTAETPGRAQWKAHYPFIDTPAWAAWSKFADGHPIAQAPAVAFLEDRAPEVLEPDPAALMPLLRNLKAWSNANAETELRENGTAKVSFAKDQGIRNSGDIELPGELEIGIPIIKGHPDALKLRVRIRVSIDDSARLAFRFTLPRADEVLDQMRGELAALAQTALGDTYAILRAAD